MLLMAQRHQRHHNDDAAMSPTAQHHQQHDGDDDGAPRTLHLCHMRIKTGVHNALSFVFAYERKRSLLSPSCCGYGYTSGHPGYIRALPYLRVILMTRQRVHIPITLTPSVVITLALAFACALKGYKSDDTMHTIVCVVPSLLSLSPWRSLLAHTPPSFLCAAHTQGTPVIIHHHPHSELLKGFINTSTPVLASKSPLS